MGSYKPEVQSRLIRDLEPVVGQELERHLATQKEWYPHEYVPWSEGRNFAGPLNGGRQHPCTRYPSTTSRR